MANCIPYVIMISLMGMMAFLYDNIQYDVYKRRLCRCAIALFIFFFGFRGYILSDWIIYYPYFYDCTFQDIFNYSLTKGTIEPGYTVLNLICRGIFPDFQFFVLVCCLLQLFLLMNFFRDRISNIPLALMVYITFEGLVITTNLMRNSFAILIFINAIPYLFNRRPLHYFGMCLMAISFHVSALIYFPLYFFFHKSCNKWIFMTVFVISNIIFISHISIVLQFFSFLGINEDLTIKVRSYTEIYEKSSVISIGYLERLLTGILIFLYYDELKSIRKENTIFINAVIVYLVFFFLFSEFDILAKRLSTLFAFGYWIIWIDLTRCFFYDNNRKLFFAFILLYCVLRIGSSTRLPDFKYDNVFLGMQTYQERLLYHNKTYEGF